MKDKGKIQSDQLYSLLTLLLLCPALRLFPSAAAKTAMHAAWLCGLLAFIPMLLYMRLLRHLVMKRSGKADIYTAVRENFPFRWGKFALLIPGAWLILYSGFVLRSGADRFIAAVYPNTSASFFSLTLILPCIAALMKEPSVLGRFSKLILPVVGAAAAIIIISAWGRIKSENLLPLSAEDIPSLLHGSVPAFDVLSLPIYITVFALPYVKVSPGDKKRSAIWLFIMCLILTLIEAAVVGFFGAELTAELDWPFFSLVRNLVFFRSIERAEALVVALWVFTDFAAISIILRLGACCICAKAEPERKILILSALAACAVSLVSGTDREALTFWSEKLIPAINMIFAFAYLPLMLFAVKNKITGKNEKEQKNGINGNKLIQEKGNKKLE